jgi:predicted Zn-dependent peptidase
VPDKVVLDNGAVLLYEPQQNSEAVSIGLWLNVGSRDEGKDERGFSHFTEHMLFKGTENRSCYDIAMEIDRVGGEINGATGKENTYYYVNVAGEHFHKALDLLVDIYFRPSFKKEDFQKERYVILDEIETAQDDPEEYAFELFSKALWGDRPFGLPVTGTKEDLLNISHSNLKKYHKKHYSLRNMICSVAGQVEENLLQQDVESILRFFDTPAGDDTTKNMRKKPEPFLNRFRFNRGIEQVYVMCGREAYSYKDEKRFPLALLNMIVGSGFSSRLFQKIREEKGLCYSISTHAASYSDVGEFTVGFTAGLANLPVVLEAVCEELKSVKSGAITQEELDNAKGRFKGNYILTKESNEWKMIRMAMQEMVHGRLIPYEETLHKIESVTMDDINEVACTILNGERFCFSSIGPDGHAKYLDGFRFTF